MQLTQVAPELVKMEDLAAARVEQCRFCKFWLRDNPQRVANPAGGTLLMNLCRRLPPTMVVITMPVGGNPRVIDPRTGANQHAQFHQTPVPVRAATAETDWCGEFRELIPQGTVSIPGAPKPA